jgi:hypothetical protein
MRGSYITLDNKRVIIQNNKRKERNKKMSYDYAWKVGGDHVTTKGEEEPYILHNLIIATL